MDRIYLDHNATTPLYDDVVDCMSTVLRETFGNPSSIHHFGQKAKALIDDARSRVAEMLDAEPTEVVFTSGGTESDNIAVRGVAEVLHPAGRRHLIASAIEHEAILNTVKALAKKGWTVSWLPVDHTGLVDPSALEQALTDDTALVSVMHANNEVGTVQPVAQLAALTHARGALFHTDAVQSAGKLPLSVSALGVDLLSVSAHKFGGPKGVGALWIKRGVKLQALVTGGRQERSRRAGTENVAGIAGMGMAAAHARTGLAREAARLAAMRDRLEQQVVAVVPGTAVNAAHSPRVPNTTNISFDGLEAESLLIALDLEGIAVSTGSACSSGSLEPSHVLKAMGLGTHRAQNSIRFSLGHTSTDADVDRVCAVLPRVVERLRAIAGPRASRSRGR